MRLTIPFLAVIIGLLISPCFLVASQENPQNVIETLGGQIAMAADKGEKARLHCFRARQYAKRNEHEKADQDYLQALVFDYNGWILNEYGYFLLRCGEYEKAFKVSLKILDDFPHLQEDAKKLKNESREKFQAEYYAKHPPVIVMNTKADPDRKTRHDYTTYEQAKVINYNNSVGGKSSPSVTKPAPKASSG